MISKYQVKAGFLKIERSTELWQAPGISYPTNSSFISCSKVLNTLSWDLLCNHDFNDGNLTILVVNINIHVYLYFDASRKVFFHIDLFPLADFKCFIFKIFSKYYQLC